MPRYFPLIDVLRGFAAVLVLCYHVIELGQWQAFPTAGPATLARIGWIGVDLFFVISGFVIGKAAIEGVASGPGWQRHYIDRRLRRIVPLYIATLVAFLLLVDPQVLHLGSQAFVHVIKHLLFIHNTSVTTHGSINGPNWSVALEMQFYVLVLLTAPWIARVEWWKLLLLWLVVALGWRWGTTLVLPHGSVLPFRQVVAASQLPGVLDGFVFGICLAKLARLGKLDYTPARLLAWAGATALLLGVTLWLFWQRPYFWDSPALIVFWRTGLYAACAAMVATVVICPWSGGAWLWPLRYLGTISYGLYLWHLPVLLTWLDKSPLRGGALFGATLASTVVLAALSWHGFERRWLSPRPPAAP